MTTPAVSACNPALAALTTGAYVSAARTPAIALLVNHAPPASKYSEVSALSLLISENKGVSAVPMTTEIAMLISYATGTPDQSRSAVWSYVMDGHTFYVLNLGAEGTFLFDITTQQWCKFSTFGYNQWNMLNGCMWGNRVIAGDSITSQVWELDPTTTLDDGWRDLVHTVTGGIALRSRQGVGCASVRLTGSIGIIDEVNGGSISLSYSDDWGATWTTPRTIALNSADYGGEMAWRALGSFQAPGRIFKISDVGGVIRIDAAFASLNNFDDDAQDKATAAEGDG